MRCLRELWRFSVATEEGSLLWMSTHLKQPSGSIFRGLMGTNHFCSSTNVEVLASYLNEVWSRRFTGPSSCRLGSFVVPGVLD